MFKLFYPDAYYDSAYSVNYEAFYEKGYRGIIYDIDNTLVPHGAPADERSKALFQRLREIGYDVTLLSNNKEGRVQMFNEEIGAHMIWKANKPSPKNYRKAMDIMGTTKQSTLFIGDQLFTDVWGAKNAEVFSILVKPMNPKEEIQIVLKRYLEKVVLFFYLRKHNIRTK